MKTNGSQGAPPRYSSTAELRASQSSQGRTPANRSMGSSRESAQQTSVRTSKSGSSTRVHHVDVVEYNGEEYADLDDDSLTELAASLSLDTEITDPFGEDSERDAFDKEDERDFFGDEGSEEAFNLATVASQRRAPMSSGLPRKLGRSKYTAWVVFKGWETGIFDTWDATADAVNFFPGGSQKGFVYREDAESAYIKAGHDGKLGPPFTPRPAHLQNSNVPPSRLGVSARPSAPSTPNHNVASARPSAAASPARVDAPSRPSPAHVQSSTRPSTSSTARGVSSPRLAATSPSSHVGISGIPQALTAEQSYWVVIKGALPGVYLGKSLAKSRAGRNPYVERANTREEAEHIFVQQYMDGAVRVTQSY